MSIASNKPIEIWLVDLAHNSNTFKTIPLGIGCVAAYTKKVFKDVFTFRFFKHVDKFVQACLEDKPLIVGMTSGVWNYHLSYTLVSKLKKLHPDTIVVFGGPHYPIDAEKQAKFLKEHPLLDFCFFRDGEQTFPGFLQKLIDFDFNADELKQSRIVLEGCHYLCDEDFIGGNAVPRIHDLTQIPSPYLLGFFDDFLKEKLDPLLQPMRGCPFTCTYCTEGQSYHSQVATLDLKRFEEELRYIAQRIKYKDLTLHLADANFGMFPRDVKVCEIIAKIQKRYGWPRRVDASLGKNKISNILSAISKLKYGTMWYSAAIQSADLEVLSNIRRKNISSDKLLEAAQRSTKYQQGSNSEVILNLPGDTIEKHLMTLRTVMNAGISRIRLYPLALLPGTEVECLADREKFKIKSRFRIFPRTYGIYQFDMETFSSAEISELVVETSSMSFDDYLYCRLFDLSVELFYNDGYFSEVEGLLKSLNLAMFDFVEKCHQLLPAFPKDLKKIYDGLAGSVLKQTWESKEDLCRFIEEVDNIVEYSNIEHENSLATDRAIGIFTCAESLHGIAQKSLNLLLDEKGVNDQELRMYVNEMFRFSLYRKKELLNTEAVSEGEFNFDFISLQTINFKANPLDFKLTEKQALRFWHDTKIAAEIRNLYSAKDNPVLGMRNILYYSIAASPANYYYRFCQPIPQVDSRDNVCAAVAVTVSLDKNMNNFSNLSEKTFFRQKK